MTASEIYNTFLSTLNKMWFKKKNPKGRILVHNSSFGLVDKFAD